MTNEETYLMGLLQGDATLTTLVASRVYLERPHPDARTPFVFLSYYGSNDVDGVGADRVMMVSDYTVRAVAKAGDTSANTIASRINTLLHKAAGNDTLGVFGCARLRPFAMTEAAGATTYRHTGAIYRVFSS